MKVLTRYSKSRNITNIENVTEKEYLQSLALSQQQQVAPPDDYYNPFTFEQWYTRNTGIISGQEKLQYDDYLRNWYGTRYTPVDVVTDLKADYVNFLKELTLILNKEDKTNWLVDINWNDPLEVEQAIPFFAKKLKEIAIYLVNKRDALKRAKLKYNISGATQALEKLFYEYLLKAFTQRDYVMNVPDQPLFSQFPYLSDVKNGFQIQIQELYDDMAYLDKDPSLSAAYYFDTSNPDITAYYETLNIEPSAYEWLFRTGFTQLCADNPLFWIVGNVVNNELPLSAFDSNENGILNEYLKFKMAQKYLGENQYYVSGGYYIAWEYPINLNLVRGNNWFYWPSGEYIQEVANLTIDNVPLVSSALIKSGATGFKNYLSADKVFINYGETISGAWLKHIEQTSTSTAMSASLLAGSNVFRFPFPGYGISGEDLDWTGKQLTNLDKAFEYLTQDVQDYIKLNYWTTTTTNSSMCAVQLNDTQLIENGAYAAKIYNQADRISTRVTTNPDKIHDTSPDNLYQGEMKHAWLYKIDKTDIPIARQQNYIHWPLYRYDHGAATVTNILTSQCAPVALSTVSIVGSRAGYDLFDSDIVYKLNARTGDPIECAFLSGSPITNLGETTFTYGATGAVQSSLSLKCNAGEYTTFIWTDDDTPIENVNIKHVPHQSDCPYLYLDHHSLYKENPVDQKPDIDYRQWQECECKSIVYSPLGHPGSTYDEYKGMADIIFLDTLFPLPFTSNIWVGMDGKSYQTSEDFTWFQLTSGGQVEPDVGWGQGNWVAGGTPLSGRNFVFKKGYQYKYLRANLGHNQTYLTDGTVPYMIVKYPYQNVSLPQWKRALADSNGNWQVDVQPSDMVLHAGDYLVYDHIESNWYCITSLGDLGQSTSYKTSALNLNRNVWINYDFVTSGQNIRLLWPSTLYDNGPTALSFQLTSVIWGVTPPSEAELRYVKTQDESMQIYADRIGNWTVSAMGYFANGLYGGTITYANIANFMVSPIVATPTITGSENIETIYADTINTSINSPLYGWNYAIHSYDGISLGGRPFWAYASDKDDKITKHKGINIWGGGIRIVDDYTLITQPESSDIAFDIDGYVEYDAINNLVWLQPLTFNVVYSSNSWCDLLIDSTKIATLSDFLYNINQELIVSATDNTSNIVLANRINDYPVLVNYWANNPFKWTEVLTNISLGLPPTGGVFVPITTGELVEAVLPYLNLTNRHYPTIATVPHVEELYTIEDSGGYFVPKMLGASTFLSKRLNNQLNTSKLLTNYENRGISAVYQNINNFLTDDGLTEKDQVTPISGISVDSSWMKANVTEWNKAGIIVDPIYHQEFIPYQTKYETQRMNNVGLRRQGDAYDPWTGELDSTWENPTDWPPDFKKQYNITKWYEQFNTIKQVWQWKSDIFGNQYALLKTLSGQSIYDKKQQIGEFWTRNARNIVQPASASLSGLFVNYSYVSQTPPLSDEIYLIKEFDIWYDTIMIQTPNYLLFNKITFDFDTGIMGFDVNNIHIINLKENGNNNKFAGTWLFEDEKEVTIAVLISSVSAVYPQLRSLDLDTNDMVYIYNETVSDTNALSGLGLTSIEDPVFTYNRDTQIYNMAFIARSPNYQSFMIGNIYITDNGDTHYIDKVSVITPLK